MTTHSLQCCGVQEMANIRVNDSAPDVIRHLCNGVVHPVYKNYRDTGRKELGKLSGFYVFTGVVDNKRTGEKPTYAQNLAKFISQKRLGEVVEIGPYANRVNHPDHLIKLYVWAPDQKRVAEWWKQDRKEK